ncbi:hypothetical protein EII17_08030 [Clostridiales bacterium COT073_COT-073]|nr:hypothetical protein EII17_08030 [Clostridiales bacterium COT073_COT-073]
MPAVNDIGGKIEYRKIEIPAKLKEYNAGCLYLCDKSTALLYLSKTGNYYLEQEFGFYNFETNDYQSLTSFPEGQNVGISALNDDYLILRIFRDDVHKESLLPVGLYAYSLQDSQLFEIILEEIDPVSGYPIYASYNDVLLLGDTLWFDRFHTNADGSRSVALYSINLKDRKPIKRVENAQNPFLYQDQVAFFTHNENKEYKKITTLGGQSIDVTIDLRDIAATGNHIYGIENQPDYKELLTRFHLKDLITNQPIVSTIKSIDRLHANEYFVSWRNIFKHTPCIYDRKSKQLLVFSDLPESETFYLIKENYGILTQHTDNGRVRYFFERKQ